MKKIIALLALAIAYLATPSIAMAVEITIAAGTTVKDSVYARVTEEAIKMCEASVAPITLRRVVANGSNAGVEMILNKGAMMALVQMDIANLWRKNRPELELRAVASFHQEAYQFIGLPSVSSGIMGLSSKPITSIEDLNGLTIGVVGAGQLSLEYFNYLAGLNIKSQVFGSTDEILAALKGKKIAGMLLVTGYPSAVIAGMSGVVPLGMSKATQDKLIMAKKGYAATRMSYSNLSNTQVDTIAVRAMLVSTPFRTETLKEAARKFGKCIVASAPGAVDDPTTHPAWKSITGTETADLPLN